MIEKRQGFIFLTRVVEFSASHRLYRPDWDEEKNRHVFGPCSNPHGHGHNYRLEATFMGEVDKETGMVVPFSRLKSLLYELVVQPCDHKHLNYDVPFLEGVLPSGENLVRTFWDRISGTIRGESFSLYHLRLYSTQRQWVDYWGP